ncbi:NAD(P)-dependent oxidoreductase [Phormidesmis priestleyi]
MSDRLRLHLLSEPRIPRLSSGGVCQNRSRPAMDELAQQGAVLADSAQEVARQTDVVITCLPDSPDVEAIVLTEAIQTMRSGMLFIDMSTIALASARKIYETLKAKGIQSLDAPVSGGDIGAQQGTLSIMVGGEASAFQRALPILQAMGQNIVHVGEAGAGQVTKACNQIVVALTVQAVAEALTLAKKSGVDPAKVRDALLGGFAQSRVLEVHGKRMLENSFQPGFTIDLHRKDMNIVLQTAREVGVPLLGSSQVTSLMDAAIAQGKGSLDNAALVTLYHRA